MKMQVRVALMVLIAALAVAVVQVHQGNAALEARLSSNAGGAP